MSGGISVPRRRRISPKKKPRVIIEKPIVVEVPRARVSKPRTPRTRKPRQLAGGRPTRFERGQTTENSYLERYIDMLVNPAEASPIRLATGDIPKTVLVKQKIVQDVAVWYDPALPAGGTNGAFTLVSRPVPGYDPASVTVAQNVPTSRTLLVSSEEPITQPKTNWDTLSNGFWKDVGYSVPDYSALFEAQAGVYVNKHTVASIAPGTIIDAVMDNDFTLEKTLPLRAGNPDQIKFPGPGNYVLALSWGAAAVSASVPGWVVTFSATTGEGQGISVTTSDGTASGDTVTGEGATIIFYVSITDVNFNNVNAPGYLTFTMTGPNIKDPNLMAYAPDSIGAPPVKKYRPLASSMMFSAKIAQDYAGGDVSAARLPSSEFGSIFSEDFDNLGDKSPLLTFAGLSAFEDSYVGPFNKGAYVWWAPEDDRTSNFKYPDQDVDFPILLISGTYTPAVAPAVASTIIVGRVELHVVFECIANDNQFLSQYVCEYDPADLAGVNRVLTHIPNTSCNPAHTKFFSWVRKTMSKVADGAKKGYNFLQNASKTITGKDLTENLRQLAEAAPLLL